MLDENNFLSCFLSLFLTGENKFDLYAHIYQANSLQAQDRSGYSDPYARVVYGSTIGETKVSRIKRYIYERAVKHVFATRGFRLKLLCYYMTE